MSNQKQPHQAASEWESTECNRDCDCVGECKAGIEVRKTTPAEVAVSDSARLDYIERTFGGCSNQERYLPLRMLWGKGANGRTLREACDKYMARDAALGSGGGGGER